ncbi:RNA polymerase sigma factor [Owenweeksia hongkongensis]|uniref:RNA polymerase sigma factor n=1 Tax=Owenweeksia hongkongensis TaxID=253245 RepID=UPI003A92B269
MEDEIQLLLQDKAKHRQAFDKIVKVYSERLYWHVRRMVHSHDDADDVLQNTYIKVWRNIASYRGDSKLYTWLYRIATNEALNHIRQQKRLYKVGDDVDTENQASLSGDAYFDGEAAEAKLHLAIQGLPDKQRAVFNLKYFEEMKYEEMSEVLETSVGALKASYHHAVQKVKYYLENNE